MFMIHAGEVHLNGWETSPLFTSIDPYNFS